MFKNAWDKGTAGTAVEIGLCPVFTIFTPTIKTRHTKNNS
jgi:hypothetical protein